MPRIEPLDRAELAQYEEMLGVVEESLGVLPNSTLTMARWPELMEAFAQLNAVVMGESHIEGPLKQMVAAVVSSAAGCRYCQAHTSHVAHLRGADGRKLAELWDFEDSALFTDRERAALRVAQRAGLAPSGVTDEDMASLSEYFTDLEIVALVAVMANFGFLNRWNDTMSTELEAAPYSWARKHLAEDDWEAGRHAPATNALAPEPNVGPQRPE